MAKLIVYIAFFICCQAPNARQAGQRQNGEVRAAEIITDYKADELWEDGRLIATTKVNKSTLMNYGTMEDGRSFILEEKPFLFMENSFNLIK
ncbi:hypothetical protein LOAG_19039 [Loa loa]|uniref:Uncharacterized protein n=1 Tax=Loa loa TaxID=7209 RepID=A0A1S0UFA9_LOALO|nr:hypothetical protein LOAG_19039 [Loa loa]EJD73544.1 hypothetical protein LOAG_19039 [Loa loa]